MLIYVAILTEFLLGVLVSLFMIAGPAYSQTPHLPDDLKSIIQKSETPREALNQIQFQSLSVHDLIALTYASGQNDNITRNIRSNALMNLVNHVEDNSDAIIKHKDYFDTLLEKSSYKSKVAHLYLALNIAGSDTPEYVHLTLKSRLLAGYASWMDKYLSYMQYFLNYPDQAAQSCRYIQDLMDLRLKYSLVMAQKGFEILDQLVEYAPEECTGIKIKTILNFKKWVQYSLEGDYFPGTITLKSYHSKDEIDKFLATLDDNACGKPPHETINKWRVIKIPTGAGYNTLGKAEIQTCQ